MREGGQREEVTTEIAKMSVLFVSHRVRVGAGCHTSVRQRVM